MFNGLYIEKMKAHSLEDGLLQFEIKVGTEKLNFGICLSRQPHYTTQEQ